jgi:DNA-binding transcriptional MocR family regulator
MVALAQYHGDISGSTAREIARTAERSIREGRLGAGDALPPIRTLASALGVSPATVSSGYRILHQRGLVIAAGRRGTRVAPRPALRLPPPPDAGGAAPPRRDLTIGLADPTLLPAVEPALGRVDLRKLALEGPDPDLLKSAAASFAADDVPSGSIAIFAGALDGLERVLQAHLRPGDRVAIEDPAYPPIRDILIALALTPVPVAVDDRGMLPHALEMALRHGLQAVVTIPRAQNPFGSALDAERAATLRSILERHPELLLIDDDHAWAVSGSPFVSLSGPPRAHWAVIRSTSKTLHPDLRLAFVAADEATIARVEGRQALGPRWVSHIVQATAAELLGDPSFSETCERASAIYSARRRELIDALAEHGLTAHGRSGLNVWVPVQAEAPIVRALAEAGFAILPGENFRLQTPPAVRVTISTLRDGEAEQIARIIGAVERTGRPRLLY